ncbi:MAG: BRCT domain-containing protein [Rhodospirillaceae bacterium]|nr:BRCT domain-containing protein [Rhodospirillaceae bacterium]
MSRLHTLFNRARIDDRQVSELLGVSHGLLADGKITQDEAQYLRQWLTANTAAHSNPVVANLLSRVHTMLADGLLDEEERVELFETLQKFTGGDFSVDEFQKATSLPLDAPAPAISFGGARFCFTGTFAYGSRKDCEAVVVERGSAVSSLTKATRYLVIGIYATDSWAHSSYGRKIEKALEMKSKNIPILIIGETHWADALEIA